MDTSPETARLAFRLDDLKVESFSVMPNLHLDEGGTLEVFAGSSGDGCVSDTWCMSPSDCAHGTCGAENTCYYFPTCWFGDTDCGCTNSAPGLTC